MTPDELNTIAVELKRLGSELNLSDQQKESLKTFLTEKYEKLQEYRKENPKLSREDLAEYVSKNRSAGRENSRSSSLRSSLQRGTQKSPKRRTS